MSSTTNAPADENSLAGGSRRTIIDVCPLRRRRPYAGGAVRSRFAGRTASARAIARASARPPPGTAGRPAAIRVARAAPRPFGHAVHGPRLLDGGAWADRIALLGQFVERRAHASGDRILHFLGKIFKSGIAVDALQIAQHRVG